MIRLQNLKKDYIVKGHKTPALRGIDLSIEKGEIFGIIGHSGAGKSTLIRCINLLERPTAGSVIVDGVDLTKLDEGKLQEQRRHIGMIFQHFNLLSSATVGENVAFPLKLAKRPKAEIDKKVKEMLALVGLEQHRDKYPAQLSGGQKQRVGIARALASDPKVLLCDEATSALDPQTTNSILALLLDINRKLGLTIVLITHEMHVIRSICDRVGVIDGGHIVEMGNVLDVFLKPQHPTTQEFVEQVADSSELRAAVAHEKASGERTILRVTFLGEQTYQPILFQTMQETGTVFSILQGTISRMKDTPYGQLVIELGGDAQQNRKAVDTLRQRGLEVEVI
ncbi:MULTISPECIES: methionine ABC transporter ATP-binding protein [Brevibacillus]|jgi:D-methionine transport system ATP-binding protein|uniref:Methionine ABC transporter ATP-binding protein n=1 Tax=Brevibacillus borstelensis AK1 TaxID=1300222 RepID=M8DD41_9BACL|nr:methionine ABC transporter ATP-binding protein [Brevibacillus borstelensis]EMT51368.1 methionine ABC transporter ATP-binding protein [Brevibacillus borstelensis AK1]KKX54901.1 methionine ABC transporter ATP-binding protein [Brevibacillus borstelensis cifa_chp40]MBE5394337.1 methionine ABC transporter ATP-binding protein [Brevibacillus borstelensis]MCC0565771.1 methionine ABC transporter ATP-binding protein [Brevibacillus borstelensis]MCM3473182.1 methionine ABC transporter ATP-binding prote